jgi:hypothetical protein
LSYGTQNLVKNKIIGEYESVHQYLNVHLPLLKQDLVGKLQEGINEYNQHGSINKISYKHSMVYPNVNLVVTKKVKNGISNKIIGIKLNLKAKDINFSKRFFSGQLLLLTTNKTLPDLVLAIVTNRDLATMQDGIVEVDIVYIENVQGKILEKGFLMFESRAYSDPIYQVFNTLKTINSHNFPMANYFLKLDVSFFF